MNFKRLLNQLIFWQITVRVDDERGGIAPAAVAEDVGHAPRPL
eukprot:SAG31_NODE_12291_length_952_cov_0.994138_1_plen_42_part_10